jgi:hypothetical protein
MAGTYGFSSTSSKTPSLKGRITGKCKWDMKSCEHWRWCTYNKHEACASFKHKRGKLGSGVSCGKCNLQDLGKCNFVCLKRDVLYGNSKVEVAE